MGKAAWPSLRRRRGNRRQIAIFTITITISAEKPTTAGCGFCFRDVGGHSHVGIGDSKYSLGRATGQVEGAERDPCSAFCDGTFSSFTSAAHKTSARVHRQTAQVLGASRIDPRSRGSATATATTVAEEG